MIRLRKAIGKIIRPFVECRGDFTPGMTLPTCGFASTGIVLYCLCHRLANSDDALSSKNLIYSALTQIGLNYWIILVAATCFIVSVILLYFAELKVDYKRNSELQWVSAFVVNLIFQLR